MKKNFVPGLIFAVLSIAFLSFVLWSSEQLPERVATHFGFQGHPDRWSDRSSAVTLMLGFGLGLPLLLVVLSFIIRFMPMSTVNIPHREYWLAPERKEETYAFFSRQLLWLACVTVCFMAGLNWLTVRANTSVPVRMPSELLMTVMGVFLAFIAVWSVSFVRRFRLPERP